MSAETDQKVAMWEKHWQTITLGVITAALLFVSKTLWESNALQAKLVNQIETLAAQVGELRAQSASMQHQYVTRAEFQVHEQRIQSLERRGR